MDVNKFLTYIVLNGIAFETGMALNLAEDIIERSRLVKTPMHNDRYFPCKRPLTVAYFIALSQVYKIPASELIRKIEVASIQLREKLKELNPEFCGYISDDLIRTAIADTHYDNLHREHSTQNLKTCDEYMQAAIDRLVEYYESSREIPGVTDPGIYTYGRATDVAFMSLLGIIQDGVIASDERCEKATFLTAVKTAVASGGSKFVFLNLYGDDSNYKCFPDHGERVADHGVLIALRRIDDDTSLIDLSPKNLRKIDYVFDKLIYAEPGGVVTDITV